ncbi:MAG: hypothetical protein WCF85_18190 [Rhodospirillaceae bacterium]
MTKAVTEDDVLALRRECMAMALNYSSSMMNPVQLAGQIEQYLQTGAFEQGQSLRERLMERIAFSLAASQNLDRVMTYTQKIEQFLNYEAVEPSPAVADAATGPAEAEPVVRQDKRCAMDIMLGRYPTSS